MKCCALALAALVALPLAAQAQMGPVYTPEANPRQLPHSRFSVTPFFGVRLPYITGSYAVVGENGNTLLVEEQREGSAAVGLNLDVAFTRVLALTVGGTFAPGVNDLFTFRAPADTLPRGRIAVPGPDVVMLKAGVTARLPDPVRDDRRFHPSGFITVGPAVVLTGATPQQVSRRNAAINVGANATTRLGRSGLALELGLEDYITFWRDSDFEGRDVAIFRDRAEFEGESVDVFYEGRSPNVFLARLGLSYRPGTRRAARAPFVAPPVAAAPARPIRLCVVQDGALAEVTATYSPERADTLVGERSVAMAYPADALPYASSQPWFINNEPIAPTGRRFVKYGLPRVLSRGDLRPAGNYRGVPVFAESDDRDALVLYVPIRPGCEFQPYQTEAITGGVRGE